MPLRKALVGITVARGENVTKTSKGGEIRRPKTKVRVLPGQTFDFTDEEIEEIEAANPGSLSEKGEVDLETGEINTPSAKGGKTKVAKNANKDDEV